MSESVPMHDTRKIAFYRSIFDKYDRNPKDGVLNVRELKRIIRENDRYDNDIPQIAVDKIMTIGDDDRDGVINFDEFFKMMENPNLTPFFKRYLNSYIRYLVPPSQRKTEYLQRFSTDVDSVDGTGRYEQEYKCCPPPLGMVIFSILEIILFVADECLDPGSINDGSGPIAQQLMFNPYKKEEFWRFLTYMFVHVGWMHIILNVLIQTFLGISLEMVHGSLRVLTVYLSGVVTGCLFTSVVDRHVLLAGASGGVYAVITAHIASVIMNWSDMLMPFVQLLVFLIITGMDLGVSIWNRYFADTKEFDNKIGYEAHLGGAIAGLIVGILVLKNITLRKYEKYVWWAALVFYLLATTTMIVLNIFDSYY